MKITLDEHLINGNDIKITREKKRKLLKKGDLKKRDLRTTMLYIEQGAKCECNVLDRAERGQQMLVMGNKVRDRLVLTHIQNYDKRSPNIRKALRAIRKSPGDICKEGLHVITASEGEGEGGGEKDRKNRQNGNRKNRDDKNNDRREDKEARRRDRERERRLKKKMDRKEERDRKKDKILIDNNGARRSRKDRKNRNVNRNRDRSNQ